MSDASGRAKLLEPDDVGLTLQLPLIFATAWLVPPSRWLAIAEKQTRLRFALRSGRATSLLADLERATSAQQAHFDPTAIAFGLEVNRLLHYLEIARVYRPGNWQPAVRLEGADHLAAASEAGRGAILLIAHFVHNGVAPKLSLAAAGYHVAHLSRPEHGFSKTRYGMRCLNPIRRRIEDRYLDARILIRRKSGSGAMKQLRERVLGNGVVSITAGAWEGVRLIDAPLFGKRYRLATGAFALARATGAVLLPVFPLRDQRTMITTVTIDAPVAVSPHGDKTTAFCDAAAAYARRSEPYVLEKPEQWRGWKYLR